MSGRFLPDANILIHALNVRSPHHQPCRKWLEHATAEEGVLLVNDLTECAFLRISTLPSLKLATVPVALKFWSQLLNYPFTERAFPGPRHQGLCSGFVLDLKLSGNDINDAWLAALAIEHQAALVSLDRGFRRFAGLDWLDPENPGPDFSV